MCFSARNGIYVSFLRAYLNFVLEMLKKITCVQKANGSGFI